jgi:hypothetical protein
VKQSVEFEALSHRCFQSLLMRTDEERLRREKLAEHQRQLRQQIEEKVSSSSLAFCAFDIGNGACEGIAIMV